MILGFGMTPAGIEVLRRKTVVDLPLPTVTSITGFMQAGATHFECNTSRPCSVRFKMGMSRPTYYTDWTTPGTSHVTNNVAAVAGTYPVYIEVDAVIDPDWPLTYLDDATVPPVSGAIKSFPDLEP